MCKACSGIRDSWGDEREATPYSLYHGFIVCGSYECSESKTSRGRIVKLQKTFHFPHSQEVLKLMVDLWRKVLGFGFTVR